MTLWAGEEAARVWPEVARFPAAEACGRDSGPAMPGRATCGVQSRALGPEPLAVRSFRDRLPVASSTKVPEMGPLATAFDSPMVMHGAGGQAGSLRYRSPGAASVSRDVVGVGMTITNHPLHRSGRALLTHPAPALGAAAKPPQRTRVMNPGRWQPYVNQAAHPLPRKSLLLAPSPKRPIPVTPPLESKRRP